MSALFDEWMLEWEKIEGEAVGLWRDLTNLDSPSHNKSKTQEVQALLESTLVRYGYSVERRSHESVADTLIGTLRQSASHRPFRVLMVGHSDTVFGDSTSTERPFSVKGDKVFGPGVLDMKGGLVIALYGSAIFSKLYPNSPFEFSYLINGDEEPGSPESKEIVIEAGRNADLCLVFEPGSAKGEVTVARKGVGIFDFSVGGKAAHAGVEPEKGRNAIVALTRIIGELVALQDVELGTTINVGRIEGGTFPYVVAENARCVVDVRVPNLEEQERINRAFSELVKKYTRDGFSCSYEGSFHRPPFQRTDIGDKYVARLMELSDAFGTGISVGSSGGASDANLVADLGVPTIDGLGVHGSGAHSDEEYAHFSSLRMKTFLLVQLLKSLAEAPVEG